MSTVTGNPVPGVVQGPTSDAVFAQGPLGGTCPVSVVGTDYGNMMLLRYGGLPTGYKGNSIGFPQLPYTLYAINLNASVGAIGSLLWQKTIQPPAGNITVQWAGIDWQTKTFTLNYEETMQWVGYSLNKRRTNMGSNYTQPALDYYGVGKHNAQRHSHTATSTLAKLQAYASHTATPPANCSGPTATEPQDQTTAHMQDCNTIRRIPNSYSINRQRHSVHSHRRTHNSQPNLQGRNYRGT